MTDFSTEFLQGQQDCKDGKIPRGTADAYNRGYGAQYEMEQIQTELSIRSNK